MYTEAIRIFGNRVSTNFAIDSSEIERNFRQSENHNKENNHDYGIVIKRLYLYCDMKLITFSID